MRRQLIESSESSSPIVTRSVAAALMGKHLDVYQLANWQRQALRFIGRFPQGLARFIIPRIQLSIATSPKELTDLSIDDLIKNRLADYHDLPGRFPCITVGMALGGASAHLALSVGGPFLPQAFILTLRGGAFDGDVNTYFQRSKNYALEICRKNPKIQTIQHFDPVHDGWVTRYANHLRLVLLSLPKAYGDFIIHKLQPGGTVCFFDCGAQWLRYRIGERSVFQVGGWGDITPQEYLDGSARILRYCKQNRMPKNNWHLSGYPLETGPESEWGTEPGLGEALEDFCQKEGFRFIRIKLSEPNDFSRLGFQATKLQLTKQDRQPAGILIEMFSQFDVYSILRSGLIPLWLIYNTWDSLRFLLSMRPELEMGKPIFFSPLATFSLTPDLVPFVEWEKALQGLDWRNIGARPSHYPADSKTISDWAIPLHKWVEQHKDPIQLNLPAEELSMLANRLDSV